MQSVCTTDTNASTTTCVYTGTSTIALAGPVEVYDPFLDATIGIFLWVAIALAVTALILKFK